MQMISEIRQEILRLQILVYASRSDERSSEPVTLSELATWLRVPVEQCARLVAELQDDGLAQLQFGGPSAEQTRLELTTVGRGWLEWMHRQARKRLV